MSTGYPIEDVTLTHKRLGTSIVSDNNGAFLWDFNTGKKHKFRILFNVFFAPSNEDVRLCIYTSDGKAVVTSPQISKGGSFLIPKLKPGVYIIKILSEKNQHVLKLFSTGHSLTLLSNQATQKSYALRDTIIFSKQGYYNVEMILPPTDTVFHVKLLSKSENDFDFLKGLPNYEAFHLLQNSPFVTNQGEVESVKFIYHEQENRMYYMNSKKHVIHYNFAEQFLAYRKGHSHFNATQYSNLNERYLYPGSINYYKALDKYIVRFYAGDQMECSHIKSIMDKIKATSYLGEKLFFYANNPKWEHCTSLPFITSDELYEGQNYQALNLAKGFGYLRKIDIAELNDTYVGKHDIVMLNAIPNDIPVVSGIITTEFQTPLSHINVLSHNRGTPNMALRDAWNNPKLNSLLGQLIFLEVLADSFIIRKATLDEANTFWSQNEPQETIILQKDVNTKGLINLQNANYASVKTIGGKAANFAELLKISNPNIPTPENSFAIPFYYYHKHIINNNIKAAIEQLLSDEKFKTDQKLRREKLEELRNKIKQAPIDAALVDLVRKKIENFKDFDAYRFRSSTNAEDLEFFSGAGLYDSKSAKKDHETKTIENAIKKVWASLWNFRAFEEREYYKIDHLSVAMGILVHRSFPNEDANGVVITKNLYNINPGFIVNAQFKEFSIVFPEPGILHDQIILYTYSMEESRDFTIEYLSHSNIAGFKGQNVLSNKELFQLGELCSKIKKHYFFNVPHSCSCLYNKFGLDIEFKIDSSVAERKLYIKQVRLYN